MCDSYTQDVRATKKVSEVTNVLQGSETATIVLSTISNRMGFLLSLSSRKKDFGAGDHSPVSTLPSLGRSSEPPLLPFYSLGPL